MSRDVTESTINWPMPGYTKTTSTTTTPTTRYARLNAITVAIGAHAFGNACFMITSDRDAPESLAIWMYGLASKLIIAARVILII